MRVLLTSTPGLGHLFPMISTAWALRAAGHEVRLATADSAATAAANAGLTVVDAAPGVDLKAALGLRFDAHTKPGPGAEPPDLVGEAGRMFATMGELMLAGALAHAEQWRPDLVVYELCDTTGPIIAARLGIPCVAHGFGFSGGHGLIEEIHRHVTEPLATPETALDLAPPSMHGGLKGISTRYVPYNGGAVLPDWLAAPRERPRILVTMGTIDQGGAELSPWQRILDAAEDSGAELVLAAGPWDLSGLALPPHARVIGYLPLNSLLAYCDAAIHHGGSGSTLTALVAGIPQLLSPYGADQFINADLVVQRGVGYAAMGGQVTAEQIDGLLHEEKLKAAVAEVRAEIAAQPSPAELVPNLEVIAGR
ncbi:glycosyltransferase [Crossiella sp. CA198]|uniref:glycosyltransferase n=1 Tax=Crossiella sp. CA198 TaxID=3455607 RepID=UPI003F8D4D56